jgi:hypothetical protein
MCRGGCLTPLDANWPWRSMVVEAAVRYCTGCCTVSQIGFRFSAGFVGPGGSIAGGLTGPDRVLA